MKIMCVHCGWRNEYRIDLRSYEHYWTSSWNKAWKKFRRVRDLNPWPLRYRCNVLPTELTSQLGLSNKASKWWIMAINIWKSYVCTAVEETNIESIIAVMPEHYWTGNERFPVGLLAQLVERAPVSQSSWVQIPYKPEFFLGHISNASSVVFITAKIESI